MAQTQNTTQTAALLTGQLRPDVDSKIYLLDPNQTPFTRLLSQINKKPAIQPTFDWYQDDFVAGTAAVASNGAIAGGATTLNVVAGQGILFAAGDMVYVPAKGEVFKVTSVSTDALTIVRHIGNSGIGTTGSPGSVIANNEPLVIIGNANAEASGLPAAKVIAKIKKTGYTQIFKTVIPWVSGTAEASEMLTENEIKHLKFKYGVEHAILQERAAFLGSAYEDASAALRYTGGIIPAIATNVTAAGGALTEDIWDTFIRSLFNYGSDKKVVFVSPLIASIVDKFSKGKLATSIKDSAYGFKTLSYFNSMGEVKIIVHKKILTGTTLGGCAVGVDLDFVKMRTLRPTKLFDVINANNYDGKSWYYQTEVGFQVMQEKNHALLTGVTS